jgi:GT2 family glycosyltransferase
MNTGGTSVANTCDAGAATEPATTPRVTAVVVSFRTKDLTLACIESFLIECRGFPAELVVVDNASDDGSAEAIRARFPEVRLIASTTNLGFGAACNLGAKESRAERLLMLNPDTVVLNRAVERLVRFADEHPGARLWGGRTLFADGRLNPSSCWRAPSPWSALALGLGLSSALPRRAWSNPEGYGGWRRDHVRQVDIVSGCFLLVDRALWDELGGFHPDFFMYAEDADLSLRARHLGAQPCIDPSATIVHLGGASERVRADKMVRLFTARAQLYRKFYGPLEARWMLA